MQDVMILAIVGLVCLTALEIGAIYKGFNGKLMTTVVGSICVLVGFGFGKGL